MDWEPPQNPGRFTDALLKEIFDAAPHDADGHRAFSTARFDGATVEGNADFGEATFKGDANFRRTTFKGLAEFDGATFKGNASFGGATFEGNASFGGAIFKGYMGAEFGGTTFKGFARFGEATFKGHQGASFRGATFKGNASFDRAAVEHNAEFDGATFEGNASFRGTTFKGFARFGEATFGDDAEFGEATFERYGGFRGATFKGLARFDGATFKGNASFRGATFKGNASFRGATFKGNASFRGATFGDDAEFGEATFERFGGFGGVIFEVAAGFKVARFMDAWFGGTTFKGLARFDGATFKGDARFDEAAFKGAGFDGATFEGDVPVLGPITVDKQLNLGGVQFAASIRIEADAGEVTCRRGRFPERVRFDVRRALVRLDDLDLSVPSLFTGPTVAASASARTTEQPRLLSLQRANVAGLTLENVDLANCRFAGAHNLEKLRLEAGAVFGLSPAVAGWERRQVIAEEAAWRAARARPGRWSPPEWPYSDNKPEVVSPGAVAVLYRALRKSREDAKDEPGAADFYYGEMEMRRHDRGISGTNRWRGRVTRLVLTAYWLVSGYGLRAWRSLAALAVVTTLFAAAFHFVGFTRPPEPTSYWTSLLYAFRSTISLTDNQVTLTAWGSFFQALLRITGPVLLGLMLLALRSRVKR